MCVGLFFKRLAGDNGICDLPLPLERSRSSLAGAGPSLSGCVSDDFPLQTTPFTLGLIHDMKLLNDNLPRRVLAGGAARPSLSSSLSTVSVGLIG